MAKRRRQKRESKLKGILENKSKNKKQHLKLQKEQKMPRKVQEMMEIKEKMNKSQKLEKETKKSDKNMKFKQLDGETEHQFVSRMQDEVNYVILKNKAVPFSEPEKDNEKKIKNNRRLIYLKEKKRKMKELQVERNKEKNLLTDPVLFNEVVMRPPELKVKPRKSKDNVKQYKFFDKFETVGSKIVIKR